MNARAEVRAVVFRAEITVHAAVRRRVPRKDDGLHPRRPNTLPFRGEVVTFVRKMRVNIEITHLTVPPLAIAFSGETRLRFPSLSSAQRIMPSERTPRNLTGFKLATTTTRLPTISSGV